MMNLGRHSGMWLWNVDVNVQDTIPAFSVEGIMETSVWNRIQDPENMKRESGVM